MARRTEAIAVFGLSPCREEIYLMTAEPTFDFVRAVFSGEETCGHHQYTPRFDSGRAVAEFVSSRCVRVVFCVDAAEALSVSPLLPGGVACCALPPRIAFDALSSPTRKRCAQSRALGMSVALASEDDAVERGSGGGGNPCPTCLGRGVRTPSAWCGTDTCRHRFHVAYILSWLEVRGSCPMCRCPVGEAETQFIRARYA